MSAGVYIDPSGNLGAPRNLVNLDKKGLATRAVNATPAKMAIGVILSKSLRLISLLVKDDLKCNAIFS